MKPLPSWTRDLVARVDQLEKWATTAHPPMVFWMSGFTFPTGFLTAVLQSSARANNVGFEWFISNLPSNAYRRYCNYFVVIPMMEIAIEYKM